MYRTTFVGLALVLTCLFSAQARIQAAEKDATFNAAIEGAIKELRQGSKLSRKETPKGCTETTGKIISLSPCRVSVTSGNVTIEMATDLCAGSNASHDVLFIQYLMCFDETNGRMISKNANSVLLKPGTAVCGTITAHLSDLHAGPYRLYGRVSTRNDSDDSETIQDQKSCEFRVP